MPHNLLKVAWLTDHHFHLFRCCCCYRCFAYALVSISNMNLGENGRKSYWNVIRSGYLLVDLNTFILMARCHKNVKVECMHSLVITWTMRQCYTSLDMMDSVSWEAWTFHTFFREICEIYSLTIITQPIFFWYRSNKLNVMHKRGLILICLMPLLNTKLIRRIMWDWVVFWGENEIDRVLFNIPSIFHSIDGQLA